VCLEAALSYPLQAAELVVRRLADAYFDPLMTVVPLHPHFDVGTFQSALADEIAAAGDYAYQTNFDRILDVGVRWFMRVVMVLAIITLPISIRYSTWRVTIALLVFGLYLNFAVAVGNEAHFRYAIYAIPANLLCAYVGIVALASMLRNRYFPRPILAVQGRRNPQQND